MRISQARIGKSRLHSCATGVGLIEVLLCVSLMAILATQAAGSLGGMLDRVHVNAAVSELRAAILLARLQAMQRSQRVDILPRVDDDWAQGWLVVVDANNNQHADPGETVLRAGFRPATTLRVSTALTDGKRAYLAFGAGGRPRTAASPSQPQFGSFIFQHGSERRKLVMGFLGRVRSCDPDRDGAAC